MLSVPESDLHALSEAVASLPESELLDSMGFVRMVSADRSRGIIRGEFDVHTRFCHSGGTTAQGGFVTAWMDFTMAQAARLKAARPVWVASLEVKVSFLKRVGPGRVVAEGRVVRMGRRVAFLDASLFDATGALLATATSTALIEEAASS